MLAKIGRRGSVVDAVELFGGFSGTAQGIHNAGAEIRVAANHLKIACEVYGTNFPHAEVRRADLVDPDAGEYVDPADLPAARVLFASPSCKDRSMANAQKQYAHGPQMSLFGDEEGDVRFANSERSRVSMMAPLRYAAKHAPELVFVENVVEVCHWGPDRDGSTFLWWWKEWERLGYEHRILSLNSQFLPPTPQSRDRVYVICWKKGNAAPISSSGPGRTARATCVRASLSMRYRSGRATSPKGALANQRGSIASSAVTLRAFLLGYVEPGSVVLTDGLPSYPSACGKDYVHRPTPISGSGQQLIAQAPD